VQQRPPAIGQDAPRRQHRLARLTQVEALGDRFWSEDEIVRDYIECIKRLPETLEAWMNAKREDVRMWSWGAGLWIRNHYNLWHTDNPYTRRSFENNPERMSARILERVWDELHGGAKQPKQD